MSRAWLGLSLPALLGEAIEALSDNRLRSTLSLMGVAIGIASVVVVSSIAASGRDMVFRELETFGLKTFWVFRAAPLEDRPERDAVGSGIRNADYKALARHAPDAVSVLSPVVEYSIEKSVAVKGGKSQRVRLQGVNERYDLINGDQLAAGRFLSAEDVAGRARVAVIGDGVAKALFAGEAERAIGQKMSLGDQWFVVIGVLADKSRDLITSLGAGRSEETSSRILIPYTTRQKMTGDSDMVSFLQGQATDLNRSNEAMEQVMDILRARHGSAYRYKGESMATYVATANKILSGVALIGVVGAAVSLLVGGLAIMNIMSTSVIERTREIGVRRALGAPQAAIRAQFLAEALLISATGGVAGIVLGAIAVRVMAAVSVLQVRMALDGLLLAIVSTVAVGLASGYYPALTASRLKPVEALRHD